MTVALVVGTTERHGIAASCTGGIVSNGEKQTESHGIAACCTVGIVSNGEKQRCLKKSLCHPQC
jgi:hypothetical protein